jgi:hypothetical protein
MAVQQHTFGGVGVLAGQLSLPPMNRIRQAYRPTLWFKRWSRRADAAFTSLGKVVHIGCLKVDICRMAMLKSGVVGVERMLLQLTGNSILEEELDPDIAEWGCGQALVPAIITLQVQPKAIPAAASVAVGGFIPYSDPTSKGASALWMWDFSFCNQLKSTIL